MPYHVFMLAFVTLALVGLGGVRSGTRFGANARSLTMHTQASVSSLPLTLV